MKIETPYNKESTIKFKRAGDLVAYISFRRVGKVKHALYEVTRIEVKEEIMRDGIATKLFNDMLNMIKFRKLFVTTHASNTKARRFYEKMGMDFEARLPNHYYKGEDEIIYSRLSYNSYTTKG